MLFKSPGSGSAAAARLWLVMAVLLTPAAVAAQAPKYELGAGYQTSHVPGNWNPFGLNVDLAVATMKNWSLVGEAGLTRDSAKAEGISSATLTDTNFGGGIRYNARMSPLSGYFQVLAGAVHRNVDADVIGIASSESATKFALQPGIGLTYRLMKNAGLKMDLAYRRVFLNEAIDGERAENQLRIVAGISLGFPRR